MQPKMGQDQYLDAAAGNPQSQRTQRSGRLKKKLSQLREEKEAEYKGLSDEQLLDLFAPTDLPPHLWPDMPWTQTLPDPRYKMLLARRAEYTIQYWEYHPPITDSNVRLETPKTCICDGKKWVTGHFAVEHREFGKAVPCICLDKEYQAERIQRWQVESGLEEFDTMTRTFSTWRKDLNEGCQTAYRATIEWSQGVGPQSLLLLGQAGLGKTHLAKAATAAALGRNVQAQFVTASDFAEYSRREMAEDAAPYLELLLDMPVLVIDDLGRENATDFIVDRLYRLLNWRESRQLPTMVTTNYRAEQLLEVYNAPLMSRLSKGRVEIMLGEDQRPASEREQQS